MRKALRRRYRLMDTATKDVRRRRIKDLSCSLCIGQFADAVPLSVWAFSSMIARLSEPDCCCQVEKRNAVSGSVRIDPNLKVRRRLRVRVQTSDRGSEVQKVSGV